VFLLGLTHSMSQLVFGIPREYAFLFFHNNWDTAGLKLPLRKKQKALARVVSIVHKDASSKL